VFIFAYHFFIIVSGVEPIVSKVKAVVLAVEAIVPVAEEFSSIASEIVWKVGEIVPGVGKIWFSPSSLSRFTLPPAPCPLFSVLLWIIHLRIDFFLK
jgi:hypothetical protein